MISSTTYHKYINCTHDLNKYINGEFTKEDYCYVCLDSIAEIENEQ